MLCFTACLSLFVVLVVVKGSEKINDYSQADVELYNDFKKTYNPNDLMGDGKDRMGIFVDNLKKAKQFQNNDLGTAKYGVNKFSALTDAEFNQFYLGLNSKKLSTNSAANSVSNRTLDIPNTKIPTNFDWREKNVLSRVKNQAKCGCCWAFCTTGNIESLYAIKYNIKITLSEQELLDCDRFDEGCYGGLMTSAYVGIMELGGLVSDTVYPYEAKSGTCRLTDNDCRVNIDGGMIIESNEDTMARFVYHHGPISVAINAAALRAYQNGIIHPKKEDCDPNNLTHGVLLVGYGVEGNTPYWIAKNSWGEDYGEKGFFKIYKGEGVCGLNTLVSTAIL